MLESSPTKHRPVVEDKTSGWQYRARTFHHLWVVYKEGTNEIDYKRLFKYLEAEIPQKELQTLFKKNETIKNDK